MMMKLGLGVGWVIALTACAGKSATPVTPAGNDDGAALCVDLAAATGDELELHPDTGSNTVLDPGGEDGIVVQVGPGWVTLAMVGGEVDDGNSTEYVVAVRAACQDASESCQPKIARLVLSKPTAETPLADGDAPISDDFATEVDWFDFKDADGDGTKELWLSYDVFGQPEPAVGSTQRARLAAFAPGTLTPLLDIVTGTYPEAESLDRCESTISVVDVDCDGDRDLIQTMTCRPSSCEEDGAAPPPECATPTVTRTALQRAANGVFVAAGS